jgi:hypothetical protein
MSAFDPKRTLLGTVLTCSRDAAGFFGVDCEIRVEIVDATQPQA